MLCRWVTHFFVAMALGVGPALSLAGCGHSRGAGAAGTAAGASPQPQGTKAVASDDTPGQLVTMSPTGLRLPAFVGQPGTPERRFAVAAARALRGIYDDDNDDASLLLALMQRLEGLPSAQAQAVWRPILRAGIARANTLADHGPGIRALKEAYTHVTLDASTGAVHKLSAVACRVAVGHLSALCQATPGFMLTIEPMGPRPLKELLAPCRS